MIKLIESEKINNYPKYVMTHDGQIGTFKYLDFDEFPVYRFPGGERIADVWEISHGSDNKADLMMQRIDGQNINVTASKNSDYESVLVNDLKKEYGITSNRHNKEIRMLVKKYITGKISKQELTDTLREFALT